MVRHFLHTAPKHPASEKNSPAPFRDFMMRHHIGNLQSDISAFRESVDLGGQESFEVDRKGGQKTADIIVSIIGSNPSVTSTLMAQQLGINRSAVSKHLKNLQAKDLIRRVVPDKGGHWEVGESRGQTP